MVERDWDRDFDLTAWRALSTAERIAWIAQAWRREDEREQHGGARGEPPITRRQRYERGQTAWDIGLDPQPFNVALAEAVGEVKPELAHGVVFGCPDVRDRILSALLANAGLRRAVCLAPLALWRQALSPERERVPVVRPEFVAEPTQCAMPTYWLRHRLTEPFVFGAAEHAAADLEDPTGGNFEAWQQRERARLEQCQTPWTMGHTPQWFDTTIVEVAGRFKDELWQGVLFGPEHRRNEILSALLANVGLGDASQFAPHELWQAAVDQAAPA